MISPTYGEVSYKDIVNIIKNNVEKNPNDKYELTIGTDSQNFSDTKMVLVIALHRESRGGIFFYEVTRIDKITNIRRKLTYETNTSLECAKNLFDEFEHLFDETGFDYTQLHFCIHVDAGYDGKTKELIPELVNWVKANGYDVAVKPESYAASGIANKFSK